MFNIEKKLIKKIFENATPAINSTELITYAKNNLDFDSDEYVKSYPELTALPFDIILHALFWGFIEGRKHISAKSNDQQLRVQFLANSFYCINHAYFFDKEYIAEQINLSAKNFDYIDAIFAFSERWIKSTAIHPNRFFNTVYAGSLYGISSNSVQNPAVLFLSGAEIKETIQGGGDFYKDLLQKNRPLKTPLATPKSEKLFFLSHGAGRTGACLNAFYTAAALRDIGIDVIFLYIQGGELEEEIRSRMPAIKIDSVEHFSKVLKELSFTHGVVNTVTLGSYVIASQQQSIPTLTLIHEWSTSILSFGWSASAGAVAASSTRIICSSDRGRTDFLSSFPDSATKTHVLAQGDYLQNEQKDPCLSPKIFEWLRKKFARIIILSGYFDTRKGFDLLPQLIIECNKLGTERFCFVHIGETAPHLSQWVQDDLRKSSCDDQVYFLGKVDNPIDYFSNADAMALPSREDPLPTVVMEAINSGLPVVLFDKSTGFSKENYPVEFEKNLIIAANYLDIPDFANKLSSVLSSKRTKINHRSFSFKNYINDIHQHISAILEKNNDVETRGPQISNVTCVVVFHNQARYAWHRLLSIAEQSVLPKQLIIVDDASTDNIEKDLELLLPILKRKILDVKLIRHESDYAGKNTIVNLQRVLKNVTQEWIWICEGDDFSSTEFLSQGIPYLDDKVSLYYCDSIICNDNGFPTSDYSEYYSQLPTSQFATSYRRSGLDEAGDWLAIKNTIPNMSAVIVSRSRLEDISTSNYNNAYGCGDWRFYREILQTGDIVFNSARLNWHRRHEKSVFGNDKNKIKNECELIQYQTEIFDSGKIFPSLHHLVVREMENRPHVGLESDARKEFLIGRIKKNQEKKLTSFGKKGILFVLPDFGSGGGQLVGLDIANEYARNKEFAVYVCAARGHFGLSRTVLHRISPDIIILNNDEVTSSLLKKLNIQRVQSHVYWSDKFVFERALYEVASWCISIHGCYNDFMLRKAAYRDFVPLNEIGKWFESADFIQLCAEKHFDAIKYFSPASLPKAKLIWNGLYRDVELKDQLRSNTQIAKYDQKNAINLVMTGRWEPSKGWNLLREAFLMLKNGKQSNLGKCYLIGPTSIELDDAWGANWNQGDFIVTGEISQPLAIYDSARFIGVLPSYFHSESQPRVVSEFFLKGIPVVSSEAGDLKQLICSSELPAGGVTIPISGANHDPGDLVAALKIVIGDYKKFSNAATNRFNLHLDITNSVKKIEKFWRSEKSYN